MSGSSGGLVFNNDTHTPSMSRYGQVQNILAGGTIPPGVFLISGNWNAVVAGTTPTTVGPFGPGLCISDGNCTSVGASTIVPVGAKPVAAWPWPPP